MIDTCPIKNNFFNALMFLLELEPKTLGEYDLVIALTSSLLPNMCNSRVLHQLALNFSAQH
jgi:hypothetical protein